MNPLPSPPLLLITDRSQARHALTDIVAAACRGGARWISVREKDLGAAEQVALAQEIHRVAGAFGAIVTIHGSASLAQAAGCDGVHLPAGEVPGAARAALGPSALIGQSIHSDVEAAAADPLLVDYVVAGPAFDTASKPGYGPALRGAGLVRLRAACRVPLLALGGIDCHKIAECRAAGVAGIAVMGGVMRAQDPAREMRALCAAWG
ncbi:thiamine phosphate synthase [Xanthobacter sp. DSM 24535]|uniref:thiamine phosphate synthase n=1 Tax=Roseixanthobacter psychrophilus TaxID=3119917 RepID=UPI00372AAA04